MYGAEKNNIEMSCMLLIHQVIVYMLKKDLNNIQFLQQPPLVINLNCSFPFEWSRYQTDVPMKVDRGVKLHTFLSGFMACIAAILTKILPVSWPKIPRFGGGAIPMVLPRFTVSPELRHLGCHCKQQDFRSLLPHNIKTKEPQI